MRVHAAILILLFLVGCNKKAILNNSLDTLGKDFNHHVGFVLYDPQRQQILFDKNGEKYFTPASNTKVLTFYTSLRILGDSLITFYVQETVDSLKLWPAGDPTFLNPEFPRSKVLEKIRTKEKITTLSYSHSNIDQFGPGWAWEDYTFTSERAALPLFGNYYNLIAADGKLKINVPYFKRHIYLGDSVSKSNVYRDRYSNQLTLYPSNETESVEFDIPFVVSNWLSTTLLADTLHQPVFIFHENLPSDVFIIKSHPLDTALKKMMQESNNFVAEQLLLQASGILFDTLDTEKIIQYSLNHYLDFLPQKPVWVDGSGLSRYNLVTPMIMVSLWEQILKEYGKDKIFPLLATGGLYGTLKNYYKADKPYIFAKTGTLSNNHNLSGYLLTKSGRILVFAFMNNNYPTNSTPVKKSMEKILWEIHLKY